MERAAEQKQKFILTDYLRQKFKGVLDRPAAFLNRLGISPNTVTLLGLLGNTIGAYFLATGQMTLGGIFILLMGPVDALDGTMARMRGLPTEWGAYVDSVTDRYSELVIFGGLLLYYTWRGDWLYTALAYTAAAGSILVSYTRARAQALGHETKVGILTRVERYLVLAPALVLNLPWAALWILALFTNVTALQRILDVRSRAKRS